MKPFVSMLLVLLSSLSYAESMQFVTVLSSPVGTFNKLETADAQTLAVGQTVNFCTQIGNSGTVELKGTGAAQLSRVALSNGTTLGRTDEGKYSLNNINLQHGGKVVGGRLLGNALSVKSNSVGKAGNVYGNTLTVAGAKTGRLTVTGTTGRDSQITQSAGAQEMVWSNEYQNDAACSSSSVCSKQYLLKSKGSTSTTPSPEPDPNEEWGSCSDFDDDFCLDILGREKFYQLDKSRSYSLTKASELEQDFDTSTAYIYVAQQCCKEVSQLFELKKVDTLVAVAELSGYPIVYSVSELPPGKATCSTNLKNPKVVSACEDDLTAMEYKCSHCTGENCESICYIKESALQVNEILLSGGQDNCDAQYNFSSVASANGSKRWDACSADKEVVGFMGRDVSITPYFSNFDVSISNFYTTHCDVCDGLLSSQTGNVSVYFANPTGASDDISAPACAAKRYSLALGYRCQRKYN